MLAAARKHNRVVQVGTQRKSTPHLIEAKKNIVEAGLLGKVSSRRDLLLLPHAGQRQSAAAAGPGLSGLRAVVGTGSVPPIRWAAAPSLVAHVHGIRQRHRGRHVRAHAGHHALDARPGLAQTHLVGRRDLRTEGRQVEHFRYAVSHVRVRRSDRVLAASQLGRSPGPGLSLGDVPVRRSRDSESERHALRLHSA